MILDTIIKNLCCAAITGATNNLLTGSAGDRNQSLIAFFQSVDALVHITPHPPDGKQMSKKMSNSPIPVVMYMKLLLISLDRYCRLLVS